MHFSVSKKLVSKYDFLPRSPGCIHRHFKDGSRRVWKDSHCHDWLHYLKAYYNVKLWSIMNLSCTCDSFTPVPSNSETFNFAWYWTTSACHKHSAILSLHLSRFIWYTYNVQLRKVWLVRLPFTVDSFARIVSSVLRRRLGDVQNRFILIGNYHPVFVPLVGGDWMTLSNAA